MPKSLICAIPDCGRPTTARGWCNAHYQRWRRHGDPTVRRCTANGEGMAWLLEQVNAPHTDTDPCIVWPFGLGKRGYGDVGSGRPAHRTLLILRDGPTPFPGAEARHGPCHNRLCVVHVTWGTPSENQWDRLRDGTSNRGERNGQAKLTQQQAATIRERVANGEARRAVAAARGVSRQTVDLIVNGKRWAA